MTDDFRRYRVLARVISQNGHCNSGHKVGEEFVFGFRTPPEGVCCSALGSVYPAIRVLRFGGSFPGPEPHKIAVVCPDNDNPVVFELTRLEDQLEVGHPFNVSSPRG